VVASWNDLFAIVILENWSQLSFGLDRSIAWSWARLCHPGRLNLHRLSPWSYGLSTLTDTWISVWHSWFAAATAAPLRQSVDVKPPLWYSHGRCCHRLLHRNKSKMQCWHHWWRLLTGGSGTDRPIVWKYEQCENMHSWESYLPKR